jgi:hypothetical protein
MQKYYYIFDIDGTVYRGTLKDIYETMPWLLDDIFKSKKVCIIKRLFKR